MLRGSVLEPFIAFAILANTRYPGLFNPVALPLIRQVARMRMTIADIYMPDRPHCCALK